MTLREYKIVPVGEPGHETCSLADCVPFDLVRHAANQMYRFYGVLMVIPSTFEPGIGLIGARSTNPCHKWNIGSAGGSPTLIKIGHLNLSTFDDGSGE